MPNQIDAFDTAKVTAFGAVRMVLKDARGFDRWLTGYEVQQLVHTAYGELYSESTITRRIRETRGYYPIAKRKRSGSRAWEYRIAF